MDKLSNLQFFLTLQVLANTQGELAFIHDAAEIRCGIKISNVLITLTERCKKCLL